MRNSVSLDELIEFIVQNKNQIVGEHLIREAMNSVVDATQILVLDDALKTAENVAQHMSQAFQRGRLEGRAMMLHDLLTFLESKRDDIQK